MLIRETGPTGWLRVSAGTPSEMDAFTAALSEVLVLPGANIVQSEATLVIPDVVAAPREAVHAGSLGLEPSQVLLAVEGPERPRELWAADVATLAWHRVTDVPVLPDVALVSPSLQHFVGRDGLRLTGWLYRPPGSIGPGPAMLSLHGGPEAQERPTFNPQHQALVAAGFTVFAPNIRGSSGFGRAFVHAAGNEHTWRGHASGTLTQGTVRSLQWRTGGGMPIPGGQLGAGRDRTPNELEIW